MMGDFRGAVVAMELQCQGKEKRQSAQAWPIDTAKGPARTLRMHRYVRPEFAGKGEEPQLVIRDGRHPVLAAALADAVVVPNDTELRGDSGPRVAVITGPNMGGKSCYIRQAALIAVMAQVACLLHASIFDCEGCVAHSTQMLVEAYWHLQILLE